MTSAETKTSGPVTLLWIIYAATYLILRFGMTRWLDSFGIYTTYLVEVGFVLFALIFASKQLKSLFKTNKVALLYWPVFLCAGFITYYISVTQKISIPLAFDANETIFFLLLVAPILEELVFRFFLWVPLQKIFKNSVVALIVTSIIFSYSHYHSVWFVPEEYFKFIYYQSSYTLILGFACGFFMFRYSSILSAILMHFGFNLGFFLAARMLTVSSMQ